MTKTFELPGAPPPGPLAWSLDPVRLGLHGKLLKIFYIVVYAPRQENKKYALPDCVGTQVLLLFFIKSVFAPPPPLKIPGSAPDYAIFRFSLCQMLEFT